MSILIVDYRSARNDGSCTVSTDALLETLQAPGLKVRCLAHDQPWVRSLGSLLSQLGVDPWIQLPVGPSVRALVDPGLEGQCSEDQCSEEVWIYFASSKDRLGLWPNQEEARHVFEKAVRQSNHLIVVSTFSSKSQRRPVPS